MKPKILIVDDDPSISLPLRELFESRGFFVRDAESGPQALDLIKKDSFVPDVALVDVQMPEMDGLELTERLKKEVPDVVVIIITGFGSVPQSVEAMQRGASDYVLKPLNIDELTLRVQKAVENRKLQERVEFLSEQAYGNWDSKYVLGPNSEMKRIYDQLEIVAKSRSTTVLIEGETGTGKEVIARRIHALSDREKKTFVEINATALMAELLESELFGHEAGAFTGAMKTKKGLFEIADGGTLFLDEIGDMDLSMQAKILRALQEKKIRRVGGTENIDIDIRLITATNKDLGIAMQKGEFREDLYYRLNVVPIQLPALRQRVDDIEALAMHFINEFNGEFGRSVESVEPEAMEALKNYPWPGNIRELRNFIERTVLLECTGNVLKSKHLPFGKSIAVRDVSLSPARGGDMNLPGPEQLVGKNVPLEAIERRHIEGVLQMANGNKNQAAQVLGIDRTTLYNKLKKYQMG